MDWYEFQSLEAFHNWHNAIMVQLNIPNQDTEKYTDYYEVEDKIIAVVHDAESEGLVKTELRKPEMVIE